VKYLEEKVTGSDKEDALLRDARARRAARSRERCRSR
jgi:hypothetical protein